MKKLLAIAAAATALFAFAPTQAEAGHRSKVIGHCNGCNSNIYSYYRPIRYSDGCVRYAWVPSYHTNCRSRSVHQSHSHSSHGRSYYRPTYRPTPRYYGGSSCRTPGV